MRTWVAIIVLAAGCGSRSDVPPSAPQASERPPAVAEPPPRDASSTAPPPAPAEPQVTAPDLAEPPAALTPMAGDVEWRLEASSTRLTMAERARWRLRIVATNRGTKTIAPRGEHPSTIAVDGTPSMAADLAFGNGALEPGWMELAPGTSVSTERALGEALFERPGTYRLTLTHGTATSELTVVVRP